MSDGSPPEDAAPEEAAASDGSAAPPDRVAVTRLALTDFRNHAAAALEPDPRPVVLVGPNGAGKTNLLEAISLLSPGRGLRRAAYAEIARTGGSGGWTVAARVEGPNGTVQIGIGFDPAARADGRSRRIRIEHQDASPEDLLDHLDVLWLTPAMDGLFTGPAAERRRFLDRLAFALFPGHGARASAYEKAVRHRNRLFEQPIPDLAWLDAIEVEIAAHGAAIAAARAATVEALNALAAAAGPNADDTGAATGTNRHDTAATGPNAPAARAADTAAGADFPHARLALEGEFERLADEPAPLTEAFRARLAANRRADQAAGRTLIGPHRSELAVVHVEKAMPAAMASTGEQKALLIGLVLAHATLVARRTGRAPVLLLDEVAAHLDSARRAALYARLAALNAQSWMTGTDAALFAALGEEAQLFRVEDGRVYPAGTPSRST